VREELHKRKSQETPRTTTGRVFSSNIITPGVPFAAALRGDTTQHVHPQAWHLPVATPSRRCGIEPVGSWTKVRSVRLGCNCKQPTSGQYVESSNCSTANMTEFNSAVSEEEKIVAITKIVLNLMKQNDH
jgi:hypothetical protein